MQEWDHLSITPKLHSSFITNQDTKKTEICNTAKELLQNWCLRCNAYGRQKRRNSENNIEEEKFKQRLLIFRKSGNRYSLTIIT